MLKTITALATLNDYYVDASSCLVWRAFKKSYLKCQFFVVLVMPQSSFYLKSGKSFACHFKKKEGKEILYRLSPNCHSCSVLDFY